MQCAGPDNIGIWQYYGNGLSKAGESCGLDTEPAEGKQPDVGEAVPADDGGSSPPSESTSVSPPASESEASTTESEAQAEPSDTGSDDVAPTESGAEVEPTVSDDEAEASPTDGESHLPVLSNSKERRLTFCQRRGGHKHGRYGRPRVR